MRTTNALYAIIGFIAATALHFLLFGGQEPVRYTYELEPTITGIILWDGEKKIAELDSADLGLLYPIILKDNQ